MPVYNKLVRDLIPARLVSLGIGHRLRHLKPDEYRDRLLDKLAEETAELAAAENEPDRLEELADVLEVAYALADLQGGRVLVEERRVAKAAERGAFEARLLLVDTDD